MHTKDDSPKFMLVVWCILLCLFAYIGYSVFKPKSTISQATKVPISQLLREAAPNLLVVPADKAVPQGVHDAYFAGYEWAKGKQTTNALTCTGEPAFLLGCRVFAMLNLDEQLFQQLPEPKFRMEGKTSDECEMYVNGKFETLAGDYPKTVTRFALDTMNRHHRAVELGKCPALDKSANMLKPLEAKERLRQAVETLKAGGSISVGEQIQITKDWDFINNSGEYSDKRGNIQNGYNKLTEEYKVRLYGTVR